MEALFHHTFEYFHYIKLLIRKFLRLLFIFLIHILFIYFIFQGTVLWKPCFNIHFGLCPNLGYVDQTEGGGGLHIHSWEKVYIFNIFITSNSLFRKFFAYCLFFNCFIFISET